MQTDPYSASKSCTELLISSYKKTFLKNKNSCKILVARAGNVIGGGIGQRTDFCQT